MSGDEGAARPAVLLPLPLPPGETPSWQLSRKESFYAMKTRKLALNAVLAAMCAALGALAAYLSAKLQPKEDA